MRKTMSPKPRKPRLPLERDIQRGIVQYRKAESVQRAGKLGMLCLKQGVPAPTPEYLAIPGRKFRCDYGWIDQRVSLEVQGGVWSRGKHGRGSGIVRDHEKANLLAVNGWRCLYVQPRHLLNLDTIRLVRAALEVAL